VGLPDSEEIVTLAFVVLTQYRLVTDRRTDRHVTIAITISFSRHWRVKRENDWIFPTHTCLGHPLGEPLEC